MIAVIFEFVPAEGARNAYLDTAAEMRPLAEGIPGFISVERFESLSTPGRMLSLSLWENEEAVKEWRNLAAHRRAQERGRGGLFTDYRLRVAHVLRDYGMTDRAEAPADSRAAHDG